MRIKNNQFRPLGHASWHNVVVSIHRTGFGNMAMQEIADSVSSEFFVNMLRLYSGQLYRWTQRTDLRE